MTKQRPVYIASRARVPERSAEWRRLRSEGWNIVSSWIDEAGEGETGDFGELWSRIGREVASAELLVLYAERGDFPLKGALVEAGMALALGTPVAVVAPGVELEGPTLRPLGSWLSHPLVSRAGSVPEALAARYPGRAEAATRPAEAEEAERAFGAWAARSGYRAGERGGRRGDCLEGFRAAWARAPRPLGAGTPTWREAFASWVAAGGPSKEEARGRLRADFEGWVRASPYLGYSAERGADGRLLSAETAEAARGFEAAWWLAAAGEFGPGGACGPAPWGEGGASAFERLAERHRAIAEARAEALAGVDRQVVLAAREPGASDGPDWLWRAGEQGGAPRVEYGWWPRGGWAVPYLRLSKVLPLLDATSEAGDRERRPEGARAEALARVGRYLESRELQPTPQLGDVVHAVHTGTDHAAELRLSDLAELVGEARHGRQGEAALRRELASLRLAALRAEDLLEADPRAARRALRAALGATEGAEGG